MMVSNSIKKLSIMGLMVLMIINTSVEAYGAEPSTWAVEELEEALALEAATTSLTEDYQQTVSRAMLAELLVKTYESVTNEVVDVSTVRNPFTDTDQLYILKAYAEGIARGTTTTSFSPEPEVTREQMVVMFVRMVEAVEAKRSMEIFDPEAPNVTVEDMDQVSSWAREAVEKALANGIVSGGQGVWLNPQGTSTSEQALVINYRLLMTMIETKRIPIAWKRNLANYEEEVKLVAERDLGAYEDSDMKAFVTADRLNMRTIPEVGDDDTIIRKLQSYEEVFILEEVGDWYRIHAKGGQEGYVHSDYIHVYSPDQDLEDIRMQIVAYAKQYIGTPYQYAGNSLTGGIDCSAFTKQVIRPFGYVLERSSSGQGTDGVAIGEDALEPGDLVFYGYSGSISHVALYIGNDQVIHATTSSGVKITDMKGYMYKPLISYRRVVF